MYARCIAGEIVTRQVMTLFQNVTVGGVSEERSFKKEVVWVARTETRMEFIHGGQVLKNGSTFNDFHGYMTSMGLDSDVAPIVDHYQIMPHSSLSLQLVTTLYLMPYQEDDECRAWNQDAKERNYKYKLIDMPTAYRIAHEVTANEGEKELQYKSLDALEVASQTTWSSKNTPEQNISLMEGFREKWGKVEKAGQHLLGCIGDAIPAQKVI